MGTNQSYSLLGGTNIKEAGGSAAQLQKSRSKLSSMGIGLDYVNHILYDMSDDLKGVNLEIPPDQFDFDLSCNIAMVLGKKNKINPDALALKLKDIFLDNIKNFSKVEIAGPGFINIFLKLEVLTQFMLQVAHTSSHLLPKKQNILLQRKGS